MAFLSQNFFTHQNDGLIREVILNKKDSLLLALAAGLLDKFLTKQEIDKVVINTLMEWYLNCFPDDRRISTHVNAIERFYQLTHHIRIGKLTQKIAYTLEKIVLDELERNAENYPELYAKGQLSQSAVMQDNGLVLITALSAALKQLPIEVLIVERNKPLFKRVCFNTEQLNPHSVVLQSQNGYYRPRIKSHLLTTAQILPLSQLHQDKMANDSLDSNTFDNTVSNEQEQVVSMFKEVYCRLFAMVVAGELSIDALKEIYVKSTTIRKENPSQNVHADLFDNVVAAQSGFYKLPLDEQKEPFAKHLIYSIAKAVSLDGIKEDDVFNLVDKMQMPRDTTRKMAH